MSPEFQASSESRGRRVSVAETVFMVQLAGVYNGNNGCLVVTVTTTTVPADTI